MGTYSQTDLTKLSTRKGFAKYIKEHLNSDSGKVKLQHWTCGKKKPQNSKENHRVALGLMGPKRCKPVQESIQLNKENSQFFR